MKKFYGGLLLALILIVGLTIPTNATEAASKKVSLKISNGGTYYGEVKNGKPNGKGTVKWGNYKTYSGDWINGKRSGLGKYTVTTNNEKIVYDGSWKNDKQNGKGILRTYYYSEVYDEVPSEVKDGEFKNNIFTTGYRVAQTFSEAGIICEYEDSKVVLHFGAQPLDNSLKTTLKADDITYFSYIDKKTLKGANVVADGAYSSYESGTFKLVNGYYQLYNGKGKSFNDAEEEIKSSTIRNGKESSKLIPYKESYDIKKRELISSNFANVKPYLSGFVRTFKKI